MVLSEAQIHPPRISIMMEGAEVELWMVRSEAQIPLPRLSIIAGVEVWIVQQETQIHPRLPIIMGGAGAVLGVWMVSETQIPPSIIIMRVSGIALGFWMVGS